MTTFIVAALVGLCTGLLHVAISLLLLVRMANEISRGLTEAGKQLRRQANASQRANRMAGIASLPDTLPYAGDATAAQLEAAATKEDE